MHVSIISRHHQEQKIFVWFVFVTEQFEIFAGYRILLCCRLQKRVCNSASHVPQPPHRGEDLQLLKTLVAAFPQTLDEELAPACSDATHRLAHHSFRI